MIQATPGRQDTGKEQVLYMAFELSHGTWKDVGRVEPERRNPPETQVVTDAPIYAAVGSSDLTRRIARCGGDALCHVRLRIPPRLP